LSAIYGLVRFDGAPVLPEELDAMAAPMRYWGPDGGGAACAGGGGLGQLVTHHFLPEAHRERGPLILGDGSLLVACGRLDHREDLCAELSCARDATESAIIAAAWEKWNAEAPQHLHGDWSFAVWDARERRLFVARDPFGMTALYHHRGPGFFAFASSRKALFAVPGVVRRLNEFRLAQHLAYWIVDGAATMHEDILRLPPGHHLTVTVDRTDVRQYWFPEHLPDIRMRSYEDYVARFLELYAQAVRVRLRTTGGVATALSSGLDSGSVTALAMRELRARGETLTAFTSVPLYAEVAKLLPNVIVDEWPLAHETAEWTGSEHRAVTAEGITPLAALERSLFLHDEPEIAAGNLHWILAMFHDARSAGAGVLLTGQLGNGGVSWTGDQLRVLRGFLRGRWIDAWRGIRQFQRQRKTSLARAAWSQLGRPFPAMRKSRQVRRGQIGPPLAAGFISAEFAARTRIYDRMREAGYDPFHTARLDPRAQRLRYLLPGVTPIGALWHETGAGFGLDVRDPTADVRLLEFCLGIPDQVYSDATHDRLLIRRAMEGLLPPSVQWSHRRGRQGADIVYRLRADAKNVEVMLLSVIGSKNARAYLNIGALRDAWARIRSTANPATMEEAMQFARLLLFGMFLK
jgi:asparagine synthase (glutamine-hydrolysing)